MNVNVPLDGRRAAAASRPSSSVTPGGSVPELTLNVYGAMPPDAKIVRENATPTGRIGKRRGREHDALRCDPDEQRASDLLRGRASTQSRTRSTGR